MIVFDTNILISFALFLRGALGQTISRALESHEIVFSRATFGELEDVLMRSKFDRYVSAPKRRTFLQALAERSAWVDDNDLDAVTDCRDSKDNKFLEVALACQADYLVSGDDDLLVMDPYRGLRIITVAELEKILSEQVS